MRNLILTAIFIFCLQGLTVAQMWNGQDSLYGLEWIQYDQEYYKFTVSENGVYRIPSATLLASGVPLTSISGNDFQLFAYGEEIALHTTTNGNFGGSDYIEFYAEKNTSQLDRFLFENEEDQLNPDYSIISDEAVYYLTWNGSGNGLRYSTLTNDPSGSPLNYFIHTSTLNFNEKQYSWKDANNVKFSNFDSGEGFAGINKRNTAIEIPTPFLVSTGPQSRLNVNMFSDLLSHDLEVSLNGTVLFTQIFGGHRMINVNEGISNSSLQTENALRVFGNFDNKDRYAVSIAEITYPRSFDLNGANFFSFEIPTGNKSLIEVSNFDIASGSPVFYDLKNNTRIVGTIDNETIRYGLPAGSEDRQVVVVNNDSGVKTIGAVNKVEFEDFTTDNSNYIIITHPLLNNANNGTNPVSEYATFRSSVEGGSYDVKVINVTDLYEAFGYGIERHPISIRNFANYIKKNWPNPEMIFLLGKGRKYENTRTTEQLADPINESFYVPTLGTPGSDNLMVASPNSNLATLPVGRLAASTQGEIATYLNKMRDIVAAQNAPQSIEDKAWMKSILHLSGGDITIQGIISSALANFEQIIEEEAAFGADVTTFYKTSTDPIQISESEEIFELINEGVSLITFFGHSGTGTFDFNIDNPDNFLNQGKLPLIISLGCYSGDIHTSGAGVSERFVFYEGRAASSFLATTGPGYISALRSYGNSFYRNFGENFYGQPLGKIIQESLRPLSTNNGITVKTLVQQLTLNGDPAILMNPQPGPDFVVDGKSVVFEPEVLNAQLDSFELSFDLVNIGRTVEDSVQLKIEQLLPNGDKFSLRSDRLLAPNSRKKVTFKVPIFGSTASGLNRFFIEIDSESEVDELPAPVAELNNAVIGADNMPGIPAFIFDNSLEPIFPQDFAIVNDDQPVKLVSSTRDALVEEQDWVVEIDTTENFNSPMKISEKFNQRGGVLEWEPTVAWENERVYYWRVSPDSTSAQAPYIWKERSFVYLADSESGWNQSHFYQYKKNEFEGMEVLPGEEFEYLKNGFFLTMRNKVREADNLPQFIYNLENPAVSVRPWGWLKSGIAFFVGDPVSGIGMINPAGGLYNSVNPNFSRVFAFPTSTMEERALVIEFLEDHVASNSYVFGFTVLQDSNQDFIPEEWAADEVTLGKSIFSVLENQGAALARNLETGSRPYTLVYRKDQGLIAEDLAAAFDDEILTEVFIPALRTSGEMQSTLVGPALSWSNFNWSLSSPDTNADSIDVQIIGITTNQTRDTLVDKLIALDYDLSTIDAAVYPYLNIRLSSKDDELRTASNLDHWRITYEPLPDLALNPNEFLEVFNDTLQEGQLFKFETAVTNTSHKTVSNTQVQATFSNNGESTLQSVDIQELDPGESTNVTFNLETFQHQGNNNLLLEANPTDSPKELYRFNNFGTYNFFVNSDITNPLLEVTFDGSPIMNGDIISAKPHIVVRLKDENPFLSLGDTSLLKLIYTTPENETRGVFFSDPSVNFIPADSDKNEAYIEWDPTFAIDGDYQFFVQGEDVTGNQSGSIDYKVNFKIINKKMISNVLNYPNPFSTSTRFVYTLTGDETPAYFKIQIYTASGRIVKEITQDELGPMKIGTHQTDYVWDGTDEFGDRLANGVYFYKVITKNANGENYEAMLNGAVDQFFEQDFGKLVIMR